MQDSVRGISECGDTRIMLVTDRPTQAECADGRACSDKVGASISRFMYSTGLRVKLSDCYRTSVIKDFIPGTGSRNKREVRKILNEAITSKDWRSILEAEIQMVRPNVIMALGEQALNTLCGVKHIANYRGSIMTLSKDFNIKGFHPKVVPTLHPRDVWADFSSTAYVNLDWRKGLSLRNEFEPHKRKEHIWIIKTLADAYSWWARAQTGKFITVDIETWGGFITCIGFCHDGYEAVSIPLWEFFKGLERVQIWKFIASVLASECWFVNQNIGYDQYQLEDKWRFPINKIWDDTMLLGHSLYPELPKRLAFYTSIYDDQPYYKDEGKEFNPREHEYSQLLYYNAKDAITTWKVYNEQVKDAKDTVVWPGYSVWDFHRERIWPLYNVYRKIHQRGIRVDLGRREQLIEKYETDLDKYTGQLINFIGRPINIRSSKQVAAVVYGDMGFKERWKESKETGAMSLDTGKETLEDIAINECDQWSPERLVLRTIVLIRKLETILNYLTLVVHDDGRLRSAYKLHGTKGGRTSGTTHHDFNLYRVVGKNSKSWSIGKMIYEYKGGSLQVLPKRPFEAEEFDGLVFGSDIPTMFIPSDGYVFVEGDGGAAEARVVSVLADDFETLEMMNKAKFTKNQHGQKDDLHSFTAMACMGLPFEEVTEYVRDTFGKRPRHAGNYDMTEWRLSLMIHKSVEECKKVLDNFHAISPKIRGVFHNTIRRLLTDGSVLVTPQGRRREFFGRRGKDFFKEAYSFIPQPTVSDHTKSCILPCTTAFPDAHCILEKHDSLTFEVPIGQDIDFAIEFKRQMERPIDFSRCSIARDYQLVIPAEIKTGEPGASWAELKEVKL